MLNFAPGHALSALQNMSARESGSGIIAPFEKDYPILVYINKKTGIPVGDGSVFYLILAIEKRLPDIKDALNKRTPYSKKSTDAFLNKFGETSVYVCELDADTAQAVELQKSSQAKAAVDLIKESSH